MIMNKLNFVRNRILNMKEIRFRCSFQLHVLAEVFLEGGEPTLDLSRGFFCVSREPATPLARRTH